MNIEISNIRTVMVCPRKFWLESREKRNYNHEEITREVIRFGGSLKYAELSSEIFGATLWATGIEKIVKVNVYMMDISNFNDFNEVYAEFFGEHKPARAVVQVAGLPKNSDLEIEVIAEA